MEFLETGEDGKHRFRCPEEGCHLKDRTDWSRYCDFDYAEKPEDRRLRIMGTRTGQRGVEGDFQEADPHRAALQQRQAFTAVEPAPVPGATEGEPARPDVHAELPADRLGTADVGRLQAHETHAHQAAEAARASERNQRDAGMRGLLHLPKARQAGGLAATAVVFLGSSRHVPTGI